MPNNHTFLEAAELVLKDYKEPMGVKDISSTAIEKNLIISKGNTPHKTFSSKISGDILNKGKESVFMRIAGGAYALREWQGKYPEYIADRQVKKLIDEEIAVFNKSHLREIIPNDGLLLLDKDFTKIFQSIVYPMVRLEAEQSYDVVQLVSVFVVVYKDQIFTHMRSSRLPETRLHGEYSIMLGGHLGLSDFQQVEIQFDLDEIEGLVDGSLLRELSEELIFETVPVITRVGLLYDSSREVSSQHIGLVYLVNLSENKIEVGEKGFLMNSKFESYEEIMNRKEQFENWSHMLLASKENFLNE